MAIFEGVPGVQAQLVPLGAYMSLSPEQLTRSLQYGVLRTYTSTTLLYRQGEREADLYIVLSGTLETFWRDAVDREEHSITLEAGEFSGELNLLNQRETLIAARALIGSSILRIPRERLREFVTAEPAIGEIILKTIVQRRHWFVQSGVGGLVLFGHEGSGETAKLARFLTANSYPFRIVDPQESSVAQAAAEERGVDDASLPAVLGPDGSSLIQPDTTALAGKVGLRTQARQDHYDVVVAGAGPAGLAAAVYGASEGLHTLIIDSLAPGGQAGTSSRIENYLGFSSGISGAELAKQAQVQAEKFGATVAVCRTVTSIDCSEEPFSVSLDRDETISARVVVIATGANYRRLNIAGLERFEGAGLHYSATPIDVKPCFGQTAVIVGGGNSAGQAAMYLSAQASHVHMLIRGPHLSSTMSDYLVQRIRASKTITLHPCSEVVLLEGEARLTHVTWRSVGAAEETRLASEHLFVMIGADPCTKWLRDSVDLDSSGFVRTSSGSENRGTFETSVRGVFAVGDVRSGSMKRVASAVGEGSVVVPGIHRHLGNLGA